MNKAGEILLLHLLAFGCCGDRNGCHISQRFPNAFRYSSIPQLCASYHPLELRTAHSSLLLQVLVSLQVRETLLDGTLQ